MASSAAPKQLTLEEERAAYLHACRLCGCEGNGMCGRVIDRRDSSVWPLRDTGYRHTDKSARVEVAVNPPCEVSAYEEN